MRIKKKKIGWKKQNGNEIIKKIIILYNATDRR